MPSTETQNGNILDSLVEDMVNAEPVVRPEILQNVNQQETESPTEPTTESATDSPTSTPTPTATAPQTPPQQFNPAIHAVDEYGHPKLNKDGSYSLKRGRKAGNKNTTNTNADTNRTNESIPNGTGGNNSTIDYRGTGQLLSGLFFGGCISTFGESWNPTKKEQDDIEKQTIRFCEAKNIGDIPPGIALVMCVTLYALPRMSDPTTKAKLRQWGETLGLIRPETYPKKSVVNNAQPQPPQSSTEKHVNAIHRDVVSGFYNPPKQDYPSA